MFADYESFDYSNASGNHNVSIEVTIPIIGGGSLRHEFVTADESSIVTQARSIFPRGFTKGLLRTLVYNDDAPAVAGRDDMGPGFYFLANNTDITSTASNFYWAGLSSQEGAGTYLPIVAKGSTIRLDEMDWPDAGGSDVLQGGATAFTYGDMDVVPIQVEWNVDLINYGGTRIIFSVGTVGDTDFDNLSIIYDFVDSASPITAGVVEGIGSVYGSTTADTNFAFLYDTTRRTQLV